MDESSGGIDPKQLAGLAGALGLSGAKASATADKGPRSAESGSEPEKTVIVELHGESRIAGPGTVADETTVTLDTTGLTLRTASGRPIRAAYRDIATIAIQQETALLVLGTGPGAMSLILSRFGDKLGPMVRMLRELRLKQRLSDGLVKVPDDPAELVEFDWLPTTSPLGPGPRG